MANNSLNALKTATGAATASLSACAGTTSGPIKMSDFMITGVTGVVGDELVTLGDFGFYVLSVSGAGSRFASRIRNRGAQNSQWSCSNSNMTYVNYDSGYAIFEAGDSGTCQVRGKLVDGFNTTATNYNTLMSKEVTTE
jgi:hypothetical protein